MAKGIPFFFKQRADVDGHKQEHPLLDGVLWEQFPRRHMQQVISDLQVALGQ